MKITYLCAKLMLVLTMTALTFACSSREDNSILPKPDIPATPEPEPDTPLQISNGVVTGIEDGFTEAVFPASVKRIQKGAFKNNMQIRKLTLNEGLETIEEEAFSFSSLAEINFPSTLKDISKYAFYGCSNLSTANLSSTKVSALPEGSFGFSGLQSVVFPSSLTDIGAQAFLNTTNLTSIEIPVNVKSVGSEAFRETGAISVLLPNNLSLMEQRVFYLCPNLQQVNTHGAIMQDDPNGTMRESCFEGCSELAVFEIPQNIRRIGQGTLAKNTKVKNITIPVNVNYIAFSAFSYTGIENVTVEPLTPPTAELASGIAWHGFPDNVISITVPTGKAEAYKAADGWKEFASKIQ